MRLTLRTLLAYLDDTLEPAQARIIGQKVAESEPARELMDHIKQVTRRRRLTTPPASGPGSKIDPNTIAEYLDGAVTAEQANDVEGVCLSSDVHLAEIAACHQILALVLGEPALVPPTAKSRMYALVHGPESIPFRKPTNPQTEEFEAESLDGDADNEPVPASPFLGGGLFQLRTRQKWSHIILLLASGLGVSVLLFWAIWHVLNLPSGNENEGTPVVRAATAADATPPGKKDKPAAPAEDKNLKGDPKKLKEDASKGDVKKTPEPVKKDPPKDPIKITPPTMTDGNWPDPLPPAPPNIPPPAAAQEGDVLPDSRFTPAENRRVHLGKYVVPAVRDYPSIVAFRAPSSKGWTRLWGKTDEVESGLTYAALPGFRGDLKLDRGVMLTLFGNLPQIIPQMPVLESVIDLHVHDSRIDLTLQRGRIVLTSIKDVPVAVRVRFGNPHTPQQAEFADLLLNKGAQVFIDRIGTGFPDNSHFVKDPESPSRTVPDFFVGMCVAKGTATIRVGETPNAMTAPPGQAVVKWNSVPMSKLKVENMPELPPFMTLTPAPVDFPDKNQKKFVDALLKARDDLSQTMGIKPIDVGLAENLAQKDSFRRNLVVGSYAALGLLDDLMDILKDERPVDGQPPSAYFVGVPGLLNWVRSGRDHEYLLYDRLKVRVDKALDADKIMELLRGSVSDTDVLIAYLDNDNILIRQIAFLTFFYNLPNAHTVAYDPIMPTNQRMIAQGEFRKLLRRLQEEASKKK